MKKYLFIISIILFFSSSCTHEDVKKYVITKFDYPIYDTIKPIKKVKYTTMCIKVKGYVNDTIFVSFGDKKHGYYLSGNINVLYNPDYYGDYPVKYIFDPYKAKKGKLEVSFSILGNY